MPRSRTDFMGDPGSQNSYSVNPRSELTLFPHLYVFESPSSLYVSQFLFPEAVGGARTLFIYGLFDLHLTQVGK